MAAASRLGNRSATLLVVLHSDELGWRREALDAEGEDPDDDEDG